MAGKNVKGSTNKRYPEELKREVLAALAAGMRTKDAIAQFGVTQSAVSYWKTQASDGTKVARNTRTMLITLETEPESVGDIIADLDGRATITSIGVKNEVQTTPRRTKKAMEEPVTGANGAAIPGSNNGDIIVRYMQKLTKPVSMKGLHEGLGLNMDVIETELKRLAKSGAVKHLSNRMWSIKNATR